MIISSPFRGRGEKPRSHVDRREIRGIPAPAEVARFAPPRAAKVQASPARQDTDPDALSPLWTGACRLSQVRPLPDLLSRYGQQGSDSRRHESELVARRKERVKGKKGKIRRSVRH